MGSGEYAIGSPLFEKATVRMDNGKTLVVKAPKNSARNIYVQGLRVNGETWSSTALPHSVLARGGVLEFDMGPRPSKWGTGAKAAPVSITSDDAVPSPRDDVLTGDGVLFDNSSATAATSDSVALPVPSRTKAVQYTLTSSDKAKAPSGWVLQGSADGSRWADLDKRSGESFEWADPSDPLIAPLAEIVTELAACPPFAEHKSEFVDGMVRVINGMITEDEDGVPRDGVADQLAVAFGVLGSAGALLGRSG